MLQNAIDWVSRPALKSPLVAKPVAIMGASPGPVGGARGQQQLVLLSTPAVLMPHPGVLVNNAHVDQDGTLVHEPTRRFVAAFLKDLESWVVRVSPIVIARASQTRFA